MFGPDDEEDNQEVDDQEETPDPIEQLGLDMEESCMPNWEDEDD